MTKKNDKAVDFNRSLKNFQSRMKKFSYVKGATYSHKFYELENEIESAKRGEKNIDEVINKLNSLKGESLYDLINVYSPSLDSFKVLNSNDMKKLDKAPHNLYEIGEVTSDISNIIQDNPNLFKQDDKKSQEYYDMRERERYEEYDTTLLHEVWDWIGRKPIGIVAEIQFDLAQLIRQYGEKTVAKYINERQDGMPTLNNSTTYSDLQDLQSIITDISSLIPLDENRVKEMSDRLEEYE